MSGSYAALSDYTLTDNTRYVRMSAKYTDTTYTSENPISPDHFQDGDFGFYYYRTKTIERITVVENKVNEIIANAIDLSNTIIFNPDVKIVAHRGCCRLGAPENSLDAYRLAGYIGYDYAETDFCPTSDNELVLMHDASINRTMRNKSDYSEISETVNIADKTLAELRAGYVLASTDKRMRRPIPTLEEFFVTCKESGIRPLVEIKTTGTTQVNVLAAYTIGCEILGEDGFEFTSFSYALLDYVRTLSDKIKLWYCGESILNTINSITGESREDTNNVWYPSITNASVTKSLIKEYSRKGMKVALWTISIKDFDYCMDLGASMITTDIIAPKSLNSICEVFTLSDFTNGGVLEDDTVKLTSGQTLAISLPNKGFSGYTLSIIGKGNFTVSGTNLTDIVTDADIKRHIYQGLSTTGNVNLTITASSNVEIQFVEYKVMKYKVM